MQIASGRRGGSSKLRTVLLFAGVFSVFGVGALALWWMNAMRTPVVNIPDPVMPKPNAFDFYVNAGKEVVNDKQIADAFGTKPKVTYSTAQKEALVQSNIGAINALHQGFAYKYCSPPCRSFDTLFPYYAKFRGLARLLSLQAQTRSERGDWSGAADSYLDAMRLGEEIPYGSPFIGDLVGIACQAIGRRPMWSVLEHLNATESRSAAQRLEAILGRRLPYAASLQEEKWAVQGGLLEVFNNPQKLKSLAEAGPDDKDSSRAKAMSTIVYLAYSKRRIMGNYTDYMDALMAQARQPYGLHLPLPPVPTDPINSMLIPAYAQARLKDVDCETQNGLLLVTLALHAFQMEHGRYPTALTELVPAYLKKLPDDPFAVQGSFKYLIKGKSYVLYSVGPDGKDDGGTPIDDPKHSADPESANPNARYFVHESSVGDVVAGKNMW